ncbi:MAG: OmpA family protein [Flavobacteriaceae bacterium]
MKKLLFTLVTVFTSLMTFSQEELEIPVLTDKDSVIQSSWMVGLGYNFVDDSGDVFNNLFSFGEQWNTVVFPSRISLGRYFKNGLGLEAIGTYNKYKEGKLVDGVVLTEDRDYYAIDARLSYDLNEIIGQTAWFDPYVGIGVGYTDANNQGRGTYNAVLGFRTWLSDRWGLDFNSSGKWRMGDKGTNHLQHAAGLVYQFGIEKGLSKKGEEKLALINELEKRRQEVQDSIAAAEKAKEEALMAQRLEEEREKARLLAEAEAEEQAKIRAKQELQQQINDKLAGIGNVLFRYNSSYLTKEYKEVLGEIITLLEEYPNVHIAISGHTDSRGPDQYNQWLSERRAKKTIDFLVSRGIPENRLTVQAFGEKQLLNDCGNNVQCPEDGHKINRRSEFEIVKF